MGQKRCGLSSSSSSSCLLWLEELVLVGDYQRDRALWQSRKVTSDVGACASLCLWKGRLSTIHAVRLCQIKSCLHPANSWLRLLILGSIG